MRYDFPIPYGWYCIGFSNELQAGEVKALKYFDKDLVLFRTESGQSALLDAYCPHLGAHLGIGGKVDGDSIACPFHGWQFNAAGECTAVPYASQIPPKIQGKETIQPFPVQEQSGVIWAWYHPEGVEPLFELEEVPEFQSDEWTDMEVRDWAINTIIQETGENGVDKAHFLYVHASTSLPEGEITVEGHRRRTDITMQTTAMDDYTDEDVSSTQGHLISTNIGPGQTVQHYDAFFKTTMMGTITPIDKENIHLRFCFTQPTASTPECCAMAMAPSANIASGSASSTPERTATRPILPSHREQPRLTYQSQHPSSMLDGLPAPLVFL
jgi:phenylpropionate dioxygenase-like ring-hydroxylating dioxygenase large terminal subunit